MRKICYVYEFDRVMGIFLVLPTFEQIQLIARYHPDYPWDIYLAETIQVSGDETVGSPRKLTRQMEDEAQSIAHNWNISYDASTRSPLEQFARDHYVVATARAGLEKRINRYSMVQRLIEDGHTVEEVKLPYHKKMADRMKAISYEIDREWGDLVASIQLGDGDNPTIGIILCDSKDETIVKYSAIKESPQLFASKYQRILPTEAELIAEIEREKRLIEGME